MIAPPRACGKRMTVGENFGFGTRNDLKTAEIGIFLGVKKFLCLKMAC